MHLKTLCCRNIMIWGIWNRSLQMKKKCFCMYPCESQSHKSHLTAKLIYRPFPSYLLCTLLLFPIHLLLSPVHFTGFSFCFLPGFHAIFTLLSSNNNSIIYSHELGRFSSSSLMDIAKCYLTIMATETSKNLSFIPATFELWSGNFSATFATSTFHQSNFSENLISSQKWHI